MNAITPTVAICVPSGDMVHAEFAANLAAMCLDPGARCGVINCKGSIVAVVRNQCVVTAQLVGATHVLFLDSDMVFPLDALKRLLAHGKDIVGALYSRRRAPFGPTGLPLDGAGSEGNLLRMKNLPTGCLLISISVFEKLPKPWFSDRVEGEQIVGEDIHFCERATAAGFEIWQDTTLSKEVGHIGEQIFWL
ncbi:MAG: hypothetical protein AB7H77_00380 [Bdellovibrionales bacterium]